MKKLLLAFCFITILSLTLVTSVVFLNISCADTPQDDFNIVLITLDALRADHLSCYGYERNTSPNIDKIAEKGIIYKNAITPCSWTLPSMVSLFTSLYPINHGVIHGIFHNPREEKTIISDEITTLAEILKSHGYRTFGVSSNLQLNEKRGFARGFDYFNCQSGSPAPSVNKTIYSWEDEIKQSAKFFLWVHYFDPHTPYHVRFPWIAQYLTSPPPPTELAQFLTFSPPAAPEFTVSRDMIPILEEDPQALPTLTAVYDSEISFADFFIGELCQRFKLDKNTLIIITADHGAEFLEHGQIGHGNNLFKETTQIPLIMKLPNSSQKKVNGKTTNLVDIMPTILNILNVNPPEQTLGKSLSEKKGKLSWLKKIFLKEEKPEYCFSELDVNSILKAIVTPEWKYIYDYNGNVDQLYHIKQDPLELNDLSDTHTKQADQLREQLFKWVSDSKKYHGIKRRFNLSQEEKEKLEAMGYLDTQEMKVDQ